VINAMHAMPEGGMLVFQGTNVFIEAADHLIFPQASPGKGVKIVFQDQGGGILPDNLGKIFDPYFTTKATGNGLGLASCFSIIKHHGGQLTVSSVVGTGTTFVMWLPASQPAQPVIDKKETNLCLGTGKILVMDDEGLWLYRGSRKGWKRNAVIVPTGLRARETVSGRDPGFNHPWRDGRERGHQEVTGIKSQRVHDCS